MKKFVERLLRKIGVVSPFTNDDVINAEIENSARDHQGIVVRLQTAVTRRLEANHALREALMIAQERTSSFADFEQLTIRREDRQ